MQSFTTIFAQSIESLLKVQSIKVNVDSLIYMDSSACAWISVR